MRYDMKRAVETLDRRADREPARLPKDLFARFLRVAELLEEHGPGTAGMPHVRFLSGDLREMRLSGKDGIARAIYAAAAERRLIVVHVFQKKTRKTPSTALETAGKRAREIA